MNGDPVVDRLERIEMWLNVLVRIQLAPILDRETSDPRSAQLYELTGEVPAKEIAKKLKCSMTTVSDSWKRWERLGLLVKEGSRYRKVVA
jgi:DNA-binding MarR family transcriptional regulator